MSITAETSFREVAFFVCTSLEQAGFTAVLTGGGAATIYAPEAYQSRDLDFVFSFWSSFSQPPDQPILNLGYRRSGSTYVHELSPFTLEFPAGPLAVGNEEILEWTTLHEQDLILHLLTPTDCVRDRLAWFLFANDYSGLEQALWVAQRHPVDTARIERWCAAEGESRKFEIFAARLGDRLGDSSV